ncbi:MAG: sulfotransferase [Moorea sp. SIO4E2]|uniref:sulfotransferase family protein n=1 Tax=Moorena sp. SIO4E2 TaxID=2607826 RepID=UPI0013BD2D88|nr:sulfotransferase [Moorena sp. SIO4E2]NEQ07745.1 sulfotransferase [Moorena sp. SIO4E2]
MTNYVETPLARGNTIIMLRDSLQKNSLMTLLSFISKYGVDRPYLGRACLYLLGSLAEFPFSLYEDLVYGSRIEATQLRVAPVFIIGHWRSGTTHLHNILSQDPQWATPTHMHVFYSRTFFTFEGFRALFASRLPEERGYDQVKVGLDVPEEEEEALLSYSYRSFYHAVIFPRIADEFFRRYALLEDIDPEELVAWQQDYTWFLKKISLAFNGRPLLLKNPVNTCRIAALIQLFPQARFVHIYRNPYEIFESNIRMIQIHTHNIRLQKLFPLEELHKGILQRYILMMEAYDRQCQALPSDRLVEVSFEQVRDCPLEALQHIYTQLNLPGFTNGLPYFKKYISNLKSYKQNTYHYTKDKLDIVQQAWGKWLDRWGYQPPCTISD